jgi:3-deoxy-D-manno-octulosonic-acid transferase
LAPGTKLLVCGSTLENEEALLLAAWPEVARRVPEAVMLLAPRHPERFAAVASLLAASTHRWTRRSEWIAAPASIAPASIFLLDSIGELASLYALARVAFVGGSLVPAGGHNPLEPAQCGVAIAMGEHTENFRAIAELLLANGAMVTVQPEALGGQLAELLLDDARAAVLGGHARRLCEEQAGATERCTKAILELLQAGRA